MAFDKFYEILQQESQDRIKAVKSFREQVKNKESELSKIREHQRKMAAMIEDLDSRILSLEQLESSISSVVRHATESCSVINELGKTVLKSEITKLTNEADGVTESCITLKSEYDIVLKSIESTRKKLNHDSAEKDVKSAIQTVQTRTEHIHQLLTSAGKSIEIIRTKYQKLVERIDVESKKRVELLARLASENSSYCEMVDQYTELVNTISNETKVFKKIDKSVLSEKVTLFLKDLDTLDKLCKTSLAQYETLADSFKDLVSKASLGTSEKDLLSSIEMIALKVSEIREAKEKIRTRFQKLVSEHQSIQDLQKAETAMLSDKMNYLGTIQQNLDNLTSKINIAKVCIDSVAALAKSNTPKNPSAPVKKKYQSFVNKIRGYKKEIDAIADRHKAFADQVHGLANCTTHVVSANEPGGILSGIEGEISIMAETCATLMQQASKLAEALQAYIESIQNLPEEKKPEPKPADSPMPVEKPKPVKKPAPPQTTTVSQKTGHSSSGKSKRFNINRNSRLLRFLFSTPMIIIFGLLLLGGGIMIGVVLDLGDTYITILTIVWLIMLGLSAIIHSSVHD